MCSQAPITGSIGTAVPAEYFEYLRKTLGASDAAVAAVGRPAPGTPFDFAGTTGTHGGNSGGLTVYASGEVVGITATPPASADGSGRLRKIVSGRARSGFLPVRRAISRHRDPAIGVSCRGECTDVRAVAALPVAARAAWDMATCRPARASSRPRAITSGWAS